MEIRLLFLKFYVISHSLFVFIYILGDFVCHHHPPMSSGPNMTSSSSVNECEDPHVVQLVFWLKAHFFLLVPLQCILSTSSSVFAVKLQTVIFLWNVTGSLHWRSSISFSCCSCSVYRNVYYCSTPEWIYSRSLIVLSSTLVRLYIISSVETSAFLTGHCSAYYSQQIWIPVC